MYNKNMNAEEIRNKLIKIIEIYTSFSDKNTIDELLVNIANRSISVLNCERVSIFILDKSKRILWSKVALGTDRIEIPVDEGIAGYSANHNEIIKIDNAYKDSRFDRRIDQKTGFKTKSILCIPLISLNGEVLGVVEAINKKSGVFTDEDIQMTKIFCSTISRAIENSKFYQELQNTFYSFLEALAYAIDARHPITAGHSRRVTLVAMRIGKAFGLADEDIEKLRIAGLLHDIGKIGISDSVLKKPGRLTDEEYEEIKKHPLITYYILMKVKFPKDLEDIPFIASHHHERPDGKGYPDGLTDKEIPLLAKILAVSDVFEALSARREYKKPYDLTTIKRILIEERGKQMNAEVVDKFLEIIDDVYREIKDDQQRGISDF